MFDIMITFSSIKYKVKIKIMLNASYQTHVFLGFEMNYCNIVFFLVDHI